MPTRNETRQMPTTVVPRTQYARAIRSGVRTTTKTVVAISVALTSRTTTTWMSSVRRVMFPGRRSRSRPRTRARGRGGAGEAVADRDQGAGDDRHRADDDPIEEVRHLWHLEVEDQACRARTEQGDQRDRHERDDPERDDQGDPVMLDPAGIDRRRVRATCCWASGLGALGPERAPVVRIERVGPQRGLGQRIVEGNRGLPGDDRRGGADPARGRHDRRPRLGQLGRVCGNREVIGDEARGRRRGQRGGDLVVEGGLVESLAGFWDGDVGCRAEGCTERERHRPICGAPVRDGPGARVEGLAESS